MSRIDTSCSRGAVSAMIRRVESIVRSRLFPQGGSASSERDKDRYIRAGRSMVFNAVSAALGLMVLLCSVSLTLPYLGQERFGVWMTISSLAAMLSLLDLGVGNGLVNLVAHAKSTDERWRLQTIVSRGVWLLIAIGVLAALVLAGALSVVGLHRVIKIRSQMAAHEAQTSVLVFIALFCANIPLGGVRKVFQGLQRAWEPHIASSIGYLCALPLLFACARYHAPIPYLIGATYGMQVFGSLLLLIRLYREKIFSFRPDRSTSAWHDWKVLLSSGWVFFALQIGAMCGWGSDALIVSHILGASEVARLAIAQRLFQFVPVTVAMLTGPLWGLYADAKARGDRLFILNTLKISLSAVSLLALLMSGTILLASPWLLHLWIGARLQVPALLLCAVAVWVVLDSFGSAFAIFMNGMGELRSQLFAVGLFCATALPLKIILLNALGSVAWVVWSTVFASLFADYAIFMVFFRKQIFRHVSAIDGVVAESQTSV
ncbi:oligosaccharide flippase family protein [Paraburkholderia sediminicola]|uniref:lipopolysaccharide biosynthesis protein n=1 Tax=Paraburkholderia sediminicola TaxID=458836 RepID=UPI000F2D7516